MYSCSKWSLFTYTVISVCKKTLLLSLKTNLYVVLFSTGTPLKSLFLVVHLMGTDLHVAQLMLQQKHSETKFITQENIRFVVYQIL